MMLRPTKTSTRLLPLLLVLLGGSLALWGCTDQSGPVEPLDNIETTDGAVLTGTVRDTEGNPAGGAVLALEGMADGQPLSLLRLLGDPSEIDLADKAGDIATTTSDKNGRYYFQGLARGDYLLTSSLRDHQGDFREVSIPEFTAAAAGTTFVDIQLMPTGTLQGNATLENATDHRGTVVYIGGTSYVAITGPVGDYSLTGVPIGTWMVEGMHDGYLNDDDSGTLAAAGDVSMVGNMFLPLNGNIAPTATGLAATEVAVGDTTFFDAVVDDLDGVVVLCEWDFEDDGVFDWSATGSPALAAASHVYTVAGEYRAKLRVTDDKGAVGLAVVVVSGLPVTPFNAIFVSTFGNDLDDGGHLTPVLTISQGLALADAAGMDSVMVASGIYNEDLQIFDGISIIGGRDPNLNWADDVGILSTVNGSSQAVTADSITLPTVLEGLRVISADATGNGESSIAVTVVDSPQLSIIGCILAPGNGKAGNPGVQGSNGPGGANGQIGEQGFCDNVTFVDGGSGGGGSFPGGDGGQGGAANDGQVGNAGLGPNGGAGGPRGFVGNTGSPGGNGQPGGNGTHGVGGSGGLPDGFISGSSIWQPTFGGSGQSGTSGSGGGGGGGGGGQEGTFVTDGTGNGGGGGGGGGVAGTSGSGGQGGGGSFGVLAINSTVTIENCTINGGFGGSGGVGGNGGSGGGGGSGGNGGTSCPDQVGTGGIGGNGGSAGHGGGGGGGAGGPGYCIYASNSTITGLNTLTSGTGGSGGSGGTSGSGGNTGATGAAGLSGTTNY